MRLVEVIGISYGPLEGALAGAEEIPSKGLGEGLVFIVSRKPLQGVSVSIYRLSIVSTGTPLGGSLSSCL